MDSKGTFPLVRQRTVADAQSLCRWLDILLTRPVGELLQGLQNRAAEVWELQRCRSCRGAGSRGVGQVLMADRVYGWTR